MAFIYQAAVHSTPRLKSLLVTSQPTKTSYIGGEVFDPTGMTITGIYTNGSTKTITDYTYSPTGPLTENNTEIIVSYTEKNITKTVAVPITVETVLTSISILKQPTKTTYLYKENFASAGMEVEAIFSNGSRRTVSGWTVDTTTLTTLGTNTITVSYTTNGITKSTTLTVTVNPISLSIPSQSNVLTYNGSSQSPTWNNYNSQQLTIGGTTSGVNASGYTATFTPVYGYAWSDGTTSAKSVNWQINRAVISTVPSQSGTLTYKGSSQSPTWSNYNSAQLTIGGTTSGTNAGTYTATFTPKSNYSWPNGVTSAKNVTWSIGKATRTLTITAVSGVTVTNNNRLSISSSTAIIDIYYNGPQDAGLVTASLPNGTSIVSKTQSASVGNNGTRMTITAVANGSTNLNLIVSAGLTGNYEQTNYLVSCTVSMPVAKEITDSWDTISARTTAGTAANYYAIGSYKTIKLSGNYGKNSADYSDLSGANFDFEIQAFIIGINHNPAHVHGYTTNNDTQDASSKQLIHWQIGKIKEHQCALFSNKYQGPASWSDYACAFSILNAYTSASNAESSKIAFTSFPDTLMFDFLNSGTTVANTWDGRVTYGIMLFFQWLLPADLRRNLVKVSLDYYDYPTKSIAAMYCSMILPSAVELFGKWQDTHVNANDNLCEEQYEYYANGNSPYFYPYTDKDVSWPWQAIRMYWTRTPYAATHYQEYYYQVDSEYGKPKLTLVDRYVSNAICPIFFT